METEVQPAQDLITFNCEYDATRGGVLEDTF